MKFIRRIIKGCGKLPYMGSHPGTAYLIMFVLMGGLAGSKGGHLGVLSGAGFMLLFFGPLYLYGAYSRAKELEELIEKNGVQPEKTEL